MKSEISPNIKLVQNLVVEIFKKLEWVNYFEKSQIFKKSLNAFQNLNLNFAALERRILVWYQKNDYFMTFMDIQKRYKLIRAISK